MDTQMLIRIVVGVLMTAIVGVFAVKRVLWLTKLIRSGQPMSESNNRKDNLRKGSFRIIIASVTQCA